jgi:hypothetical protein
VYQHQVDVLWGCKCLRILHLVCTFEGEDEECMLWMLRYVLGTSYTS